MTDSFHELEEIEESQAGHREEGEGPGLTEACLRLCGSRDVIGCSQGALLDQMRKDVLVLSLS